MRSPVDVTAVVPVHRDAGTIPELHRRLAAALETAVPGRWSIAFVDDACPEGSLEALRRIAAADPAVGVLALAENVGQHRAAMAGLRRAPGRAAVVLDGDLQDPPEAIPRLLARLGPDAAAVFAARRGVYQPWPRQATSWAFKAALAAAAGVPWGAGMFVAMERRMVERLVETEPARPFLPAMIGRSGLPVAAIGVEREPGGGRASSYGAAARWATGLRAVAWAGARRAGLQDRSASRPAPVAEAIGALAPHRP